MRKRKNESFKFDEIIVMLCGAQKRQASSNAMLEGEEKDYFHLYFMTRASFEDAFVAFLPFLSHFCVCDRQKTMT